MVYKSRRNSKGYVPADTTGQSLFRSGAAKSIFSCSILPGCSSSSSSGCFHQAGGTVFGRDHGFGKIRTSEAYAAAVPVVDYDSFSEYIGRTRTGEHGRCAVGLPEIKNGSQNRLVPPRPKASSFR
ncbi:MAG: GH3 auxin-responsive promoter family protein [Alistipes indistinctus]